MSEVAYSATPTELLFVDPHTDFRSKGGRVWLFIKGTAGAVCLLNNLRAISKAGDASRPGTA
jgi:hypothetical protein